MSRAEAGPGLVSCLKREVCCLGTLFEYDCLGRAIDSARVWLVSDDGGDFQLVTPREMSSYVDHVCAAATASGKAVGEAEL